MKVWEPVQPDFFEQDTPSLALELLGQILVHETPEGITAGKIVEVEMYRGPLDRGAHTFGGRMTPRTQAMFGPPGHAYIYLIYGMYDCLNVVAAPVGAPEAILIRAVEAVAGLDLMRARRGWRGNPRGLTNGPGKLAQAFGITRRHYGHPLWQTPLYIALGQSVPTESILRGPRINIDYAGEARTYPWRFWIRDHPWVSR